MKMNRKIYLLMEGMYSDGDDEYKVCPIQAFESNELAEKAMEGLNNFYQEKLAKSDSKMKEFSDRVEKAYYAFTFEEQDKLIAKIRSDRDKFAQSEEYYFCFDIPTYSVQEIDLIN